MSKVAIVTLCLGVVGCLSNPAPSTALQRVEAIQIAKGEIGRRHIRLPSDCEITIVDGVRNVEAAGLREEYFVRFTFTRNGRREVFYQVEVNKRSRRVDGFLDYRDTTPGDVTSR